ncbi:MAG: CRISPR-associated ring nuclease [Methylococcaceae bacterium]
MNTMNTTKNSILLCTLGVSWAVIPEAYALLDPDDLPLYQHHPQADSLERLRQEYSLVAPGEIWVCTTQGQRTTEGIKKLQAWINQLHQPPILRVWQAKGTDELANHEECRHIRELIFRACLHAAQRVCSGQLILSLAGGRKTMSADLQEAGALFGCHALLHVIGREGLPDCLRAPEPETLAHPLAADVCSYVLPLAVGSGQRSELLDVDFEHRGRVSAERFGLCLPDNAGVIAWTQPDEWLIDEIVQRQKAGSRLLGNFLQGLGRHEHHENWRSLYRLPPARIDALRQTALDESHRDWLSQLPKADLHRHVGGCLDLEAQIGVGRAVWEDMTEYERAEAYKRVRPLLEAQEWEWNWPGCFQQPKHLRAHAIAALLVHTDTEQLNNRLWGVTEPRFALRERRPYGFAYYERPGELTGSAILCHPAAITPYAQAIVDLAVREGLGYVELRGSPQKYHGDGLEFLKAFQNALTVALAAHTRQGTRCPVFRFIIIANRGDIPEVIEQVVHLAARAKESLGDFVVGLDVAGNESNPATLDFDALAQLFEPVFRVCLPITIHAGEGESAENIWQAAYKLHADRIGHGLSLADHPDLARRFRDRNIALELCPTSNREVVGFYDPAIPADYVKQARPYPLLKLWRDGIPLSICTDNPGISRTTLTDEYLTAARMVRGNHPISLWDTLAIIKQGYAHAFLPSTERENLMKQIDAMVYEQLV